MGEVNMLASVVELVEQFAWTNNYSPVFRYFGPVGGGGAEWVEISCTIRIDRLSPILAAIVGEDPPKYFKATRALFLARTEEMFEALEQAGWVHMRPPIIQLEPQTTGNNDRPWVYTCRVDLQLFPVQ